MSAKRQRKRPEHEPTGLICACGLPADRHRARKRPEHKPSGDPCKQCGLPAAKHRIRADDGHRRVYIVGIDGEGSGRKPHLLRYMAAVSEDGKLWDKHAPDGLSTLDCLATIMAIPAAATIVGFSLGYDHTHWLRDLSDRNLYRLFHEETRVKVRNGRRYYKAIRHGEYRLNYMNGKLTVRLGKEARVIWDIWRFFQSAFTVALVRWGIATAEQLAAMQAMKDARGSAGWDITEDERAYCRDECGMLCRLMRALLDAHDNAGLVLKDYYGAGSSSSAMLRVMGIKKHMVPVPEEISDAVKRAFFGGRFENSIIGPVECCVHSADISSAYPYQTAKLPCLKHGQWVHAKTASNAAIAKADAALVSWSLPEGTGLTVPEWAPWPVRTKDGSIIYPAAALGGWTWGNEWLAGLRLAPGAVMREAWLYHTGCDCHPFARIVDYYVERLKLGKDGKGLAIKLAINGVYGKLAQTKGRNPPFQSFVWAGIITSNTRAMLLDAIDSSVIMVATDGIFSTRPLTLAKPIDTGTGPDKPLGGWETKLYKDGIFAARPGIYWPLHTDDLGDIKARGIGKALVRRKRPEIMQAFADGKTELTLEGLPRFCGAKDSVSFAPKRGVYKRSPKYGEWLDESQRVSFDVAPKRSGVTGGKLGLVPWHGEESAPYSKLVERKAIESGALLEEEEITGSNL